MTTEKHAKSEMPFLDHLEELRWRLLRVGLAVIIGSFIGYFLIRRFDVIALLMIPIEPHLTTGRLVFTRPTDAFLITLKLSVLTGAILAFPVILWQVWGFLSPALYEHEKRHIVPSTMAGLGLFMAGAWMAYLWILPAAVGILLSPRFVGSALEPFITASEYFSFATQVIVAFGLVFELPLVMVLLATLGLVSPQFFARNRQYAVVIGAMVAAFVTPPDIFSMLMMMAPIVLLYEVGIAVGKVIWKRRHRKSVGEPA